MNKLTGGSLILALMILAGCASAPPPPAVGVWGVDINSPLGALQATLTLNEDGTGNMSSDLGETSVADVVYDGPNVMFSTEIDAQGQSVMLDFSGSVAGDALEGTFATDFGDLPVSGTRQE